MSIELLTSAELAEILDVPPRTLDQWVSTGKGPRYIKIGRHRRYRPTDVEQWLDERTRGGTA